MSSVWPKTTICLCLVTPTPSCPPHPVGRVGCPMVPFADLGGGLTCVLLCDCMCLSVCMGVLRHCAFGGVVVHVRTRPYPWAGPLPAPFPAPTPPRPTISVPLSTVVKTEKTGASIKPIFRRPHVRDQPNMNQLHAHSPKRSRHLTHTHTPNATKRILEAVIAHDSTKHA